MSLTNFVPNVTPITSTWLNGVDVTVNGVLQGATTVAQAQTALGIVSPVSLPLQINQGGTGATTENEALAALGGVSATANAIGTLINPLQGVETANQVVNYWYPFLHPQRYGVVGDGVTDDSTAVTTWTTIVNATSYPVSTWPTGLKVLCGPFTITANNFTWNCYSQIISKVQTVAGTHITCSGNNLIIRGLYLNGNQSAFANSYLNGMLINNCNYVYLEDVTITNCSANNLTLDTIAHGAMTNCILSYSAALGSYLNTLSYFNFNNCKWLYCGWGFQVTTWPGLNAEVGSFAMALRFRSHHCTFTSCISLQSGRDGFNINQGSYSCKYIGCSVWEAGDGGFTVAGDNTGTGRLGEGEVIYDSEWIDCEAYNCFGGGWVGETITYNCSIIGGRYYNNGRSVGLTAYARSVPCGIYVANFTQGILIRGVKCYDDRQFCLVSSVANGGTSVAVTGWGTTANWGLPQTPNFTPTIQSYPRVAFYNAAFVFQGYGTVSSEGAGVITVGTTAVNGVTLANIAAGWLCSQRTQHNGIFIDQQAQGTVDMDGWGQLPGAGGILEGYKVGVYPSSGYNIINRSDNQTTSPELLANPSWDSSYTTGWTYTGAGTASYYTTPGGNLHSPGCLYMIAGTGTLTGTSTLITGGNSYTQEGWLEASCLITCPGPGGVSMTINNVSFSTTVTHPGGGTKRLKIGFYCPTGSAVSMVLTALNGASAYFDEASIKMHYEPFDNRDTLWPTRNLAV